MCPDDLREHNRPCPDRVLLEGNAETSLRAHPEAGLLLPASSLQLVDDPDDRVEHLLHLLLDRRRHLETRWNSTFDGECSKKLDIF